ncbi:MFS transporter [Aggregatibacter actinomycetemcomitans]|nr:MFS transporter [Aggregatibacter actinomycetemcomitans]
MDVPKKITVNYASYTSIRMLIGVYHIMYLLSTGVSLQEIALLQAIFTATIILFEIPLAMFADEYNRKLSVIIGVLTNIVFYILCLKAPNMLYLCFAQIFYGLSASFISGALEGWIINELNDNNKYSYYNHLTVKISSIGSILSGVISFLIYKSTKNFTYLYIISAILMSITLISFVFIPQTIKNQANIDKKQQIEHFLYVYNRVIRKSDIYYYIIISVFFTMIMQVVFFYWQPVVSYQEKNYEYLLLFCYIGVFLSQFLYNHLISKYNKKIEYFKYQITLYAISIFCIITILILKYLTIKDISIIFYIIMMGALTTIPILLQNKFVSSNQDLNDVISTTFSLFSFISRVFSIFLLISIYFIPKIENPVNLFYIPLIILFINLLIHFKWLKKNKFNS